MLLLNNNKYIMTRLINILYALIFLWILRGLFRLFDYLSDFTELAHNTINSYFDISISVSNAILLSYILYKLIKFEKVLNEISKKPLFNKENGAAFFSIGMAFIYYSILKFILQLIQVFSNSRNTEEFSLNDSGQKFGEAIGSSFPLLTLALFLLIIANLMKDGYELKKENELTI